MTELVESRSTVDNEPAIIKLNHNCGQHSEYEFSGIEDQTLSLPQLYTISCWNLWQFLTNNKFLRGSCMTSISKLLLATVYLCSVGLLTIAATIIISYYAMTVEHLNMSYYLTLICTLAFIAYVIFWLRCHLLSHLVVETHN